MKLRLRELELNMEAVFYTYFHSDWIIDFRIRRFNMIDYEFLLFSDFIIVLVNHHIDKVPQPDLNTIVSFKLFVNAVKSKII